MSEDTWEQRYRALKADMDRVARAVYPHKEERFTYSIEFVIEEVKRLKSNIHLAAGDSTFAKKLNRLVSIPGVITEVDFRCDAINKVQCRIRASDSNPETDYHKYVDHFEVGHDDVVSAFLGAVRNSDVMAKIKEGPL